MESLFIGYVVYNATKYFKNFMKNKKKTHAICECTKIIFQKDSELYCEQFVCKKCCLNNCINKYKSTQL